VLEGVMSLETFPLVEWQENLQMYRDSPC
jgi:hypothetical protein